MRYDCDASYIPSFVLLHLLIQLERQYLTLITSFRIRWYHH